MSLPPTSRRTRLRPRDVGALLALAVLAVVCGLAFAPAFGGRLVGGDVAPGRLVAAVVVGALVPVLAVGMVRRFRGEPLLAAAVGLLAAVAGVVVAARPGGALFAGPYRLLTAALPATADGPATAAVGLVTAVCATVAALVVAYARRRGAAIVAPLVCLGLALALDAGIGAPPGWYAAAVLVPAGALLALVRAPLTRSGAARDRSLRVARAAFPLLGAAVVLAVAGGVAGALAGSRHLPGVRARAADARDLVAAPIMPRRGSEPMEEYPALAKDVVSLRLSGSSTRRLDELAAVTLDRFTGRTWTTTAAYRRAGTTLHDPTGSRPVTVTVTARDPGPLDWLPRPAEPTSVDRTDLGIDEATGDLVVPAGTAFPRHYRVSGSAPVTPTAALSGDRVTPRRGPVATDGRPVPKAIRTLAGQVRAVHSDYLALVTLGNRLRADGWYVDTGKDAPDGNGYAQLQNLLTAPAKHVGSSEQYASAFAVTARQAGFDARLVLGFVPRYTKSGHTFTVTGRDVHAWAQVHFAAHGWVTFDPTPTRESGTADDPQPSEQNPQPTGAASSPRPSPHPPAPASRSRTPHAAAATASPTWVWPAVAAGAVVIVLLVGGPPTAKSARRRRRRGARVPPHAVYGAWRETTDRLGEAGAPPPHGRSIGEVAATAPTAARDEVRALGRVVDRAGYAPESANFDDARRAWQHHDAVARALRAGLRPWRRLRRAVDPRPLWRR